ncbi:MAG: protein kinase [Planctomycetes bacterium]|nr:protein kinase [Planctomycetota bacterium]
MTMSECLDEKCLDRYARGLLSDNRRRRTEAHLSRCGTCREALKAARASLHLTPAAAADGKGSGVVPQQVGDSGKPALGSIGRLPRMSSTPMDELVGEKAPEIMFGDYQVLSELPQGGQALVYKALHVPTKTKVALKVLLPALLGSQKARWQFEREVELAASLSHPCIVTIRDSGISRGQYYFSMEYIHGRHLDQYVNAKSLSLRDKMKLFCRLCEAMTHAHQRGVIHRDLKPSNVLVDEQGEPHILDFGLAKAAGEVLTTPQGAVMPSMTGQLKGTLSYMSPEQAAGRIDLIDVRTDVYTLGVILYQMLTGRFPYDVSGSHLEVLQNIQDTEPERPRHRISRFDSDLETILLKALAKDRTQRYQSAAELQHDVRCWLEGLPIIAKSVSSLYLLRKIMRRHRYTSTVVGLLLATLSSFLVVSFYLSRQLLAAQRNGTDALEKLEGKKEEYRYLAEELIFLHKLDRELDQWHQGQSRPTSLPAVGNETKEDRALRFLREEVPLEQKRDRFRQQLETEPGFAEFVIAEHLLRDGRPEEARQSYEQARSYPVGPGGISAIKMRINLQLDKLSRGSQEDTRPLPR